MMTRAFQRLTHDPYDPSNRLFDPFSVGCVVSVNDLDSFGENVAITASTAKNHFARWLKYEFFWRVRGIDVYRVPPKTAP